MMTPEHKEKLRLAREAAKEKRSGVVGNVVSNPPLEEVTPQKEEIKKKDIILKNLAGETMETKDYFFKNIVPSWFNMVCGMPVDREDLIDVFNKIFNPKLNFLFYKCRNKEVYLVIIPLKYSDINEKNDSLDGDFQKHAISFVQEGSVNLETLKLKLTRVFNYVKKTKELQ